jgi:hypothetical protein
MIRSDRLTWLAGVAFAITLFMSGNAAAQFSTKTGDTAATAGGGCTSASNGFAWPDANGNVLRCISNVWTVVGQPITAAGSSGYVQYNNSNALSGSSNLFWNNGSSKLGIGTATPANTLDVNGAMAAGTYAGIAAPSNGLMISGNLGIGSASPATNLDLNGSFSVGSGLGYTLTTLNGAITLGTTTIPVVSTTNYPSVGTLGFNGGTEIVTYTGKTGTSFTGCTRGAYGTTAASHGNGIAVYDSVLRIVPGLGAGSYGSILTVFSNQGVTMGAQQFPGEMQGVGNAIAAAFNMGGNANSGSNSLTLGVADGASPSAGQEVNAIGVGAQARPKGVNSQAFGSSVTAAAFAEQVVGQTNALTGSETFGSWSGTDPVFTVAIGTTTNGTPTNALMIFQNGQMLVNGGTTVTVPTGTASLTPMGTSTATGAAALNATNSSGTSLLYVRNDGHVGIGSTSPANALDVNGAIVLGGYAGTAAPANGLIASGNVGVGTAMPQSLLHVYNGELQVSSSGAACAAANAGALRYANARLQYCNGTSWAFVN